MFDFGHPGPKKDIPVFTLDKREIARARQRGKLNKVEWRLVIFMPVLLGLIIWTMLDWSQKISAALAGAFVPIPPVATLRPMIRPQMDTLPDLPSEAQIAEVRNDVSALVTAGQPPPLMASGLDALSLAWAEAQLAADVKLPPLPQRFTARDLILAEHVRIGSPLVLEGQLEDRLTSPVSGSDRIWQRALVSLDAGQFVEVLAGPETTNVVLGHHVRLIGRFLGYDELPTANATTQRVPLILARLMIEPTAEAHAEDLMAEYHRAWSMPEDLWDEVDDARLWTETRPYYYTLGHVLRDRTTPGVYEKVPDGNQAADDIHLNPSGFRGQLFRVTGRVYHAWIDDDVARDQPFGVGRVVRILFWKVDVAPVTETVDGVTKRRTDMSVLRLYELAAISDAPLPARGENIVAVGRFLKLRAIAVEHNAARDKANGLQPHSDRRYPWMFVSDGWQHIEGPAPYSLTPMAWVISFVCLVGIIVGIYWWYTEVRLSGRAMRAKVQEMRANRARLFARDEAQAASNPAPPAEQQAPPTEPGSSTPER